jgi:hypothetical protein
VMLTPTLIEPLIGTVGTLAGDQQQPSIVWITNTSPHKNHLAGVAAARIYYEMGGTLPLLVAGPSSDLLDPRSGSKCLGTRAFAAAPEVVRHTQFLGELSDAAYLGTVASAAVVWHNVIIDNGTFVVFDAARANRHVVSTDYPQIRYLCERYGIAPIWHRPTDPVGAAQALASAESRFRAGERPLHALRGDIESDRTRAYAAVLRRLFEDVYG